MKWVKGRNRWCGVVSNSLLCFTEKVVSARKLGLIDLFTGNEGMGMF